MTSSYLIIFVNTFQNKSLILFNVGAVGSGEFRTIPCNHFHMGRFVTIYFDHPGTLTVCEFEVYRGRFP